MLPTPTGPTWIVVVGVVVAVAIWMTTRGLFVSLETEDGGKLRKWLTDEGLALFVVGLALLLYPAGTAWMMVAGGVVMVVGIWQA